MTVVFVHGWGFGPAVWAPVLAHLPGVPARCLDLGFFGTPDLEMGGATLAVGHSLGVLWLLAEHPGLPVIAINGFPRFTAAGDFPDGVPPRMVERMERRLSPDPTAVLTDFRARCGAGPADAAPDAERLAWGLRLLRDGDARPAPPPRQALAGHDDPIVSPAMTRAAWPEAQMIAGGHLLPLTAPEAVASLVRDTLEPA